MHNSNNMIESMNNDIPQSSAEENSIVSVDFTYKEVYEPIM